MTTQPRDLTRLSAALAGSATRLDARSTGATGASEAADSVTPGDVDRVRRLLTRVAEEISRHATAVRRLDEEIELLSRRRDHPDAAHLSELRRRRAASDARLRQAVREATTALVPGGDLLDPASILRRLTGTAPAPVRSYFGRPAVDRGERVRRLTALLLRGNGLAAPVRHESRPVTVVVPTRATRLARVRRRLLRTVHPTVHVPTGASS